MDKVKLLLLVAFVGLAIYFASLYYRILSFLNTYEYSYKITNVSSNLLLGLSNIKNGVTADFKFIINVINPSSFKVTVSNLTIKFYYKGTYLGKSDNFAPIYIPTNGKTSFTGNASILVNNALFQTILSLQNEKTVISYTAKFKLYGLPFKFTYNGEREINLADYL